MSRITARITLTIDSGEWSDPVNQLRRALEQAFHPGCVRELDMITPDALTRRCAEELRREIAREEGMLHGVDAYNEAMGYDLTPPEPGSRRGVYWGVICNSENNCSDLPGRFPSIEAANAAGQDWLAEMLALETEPYDPDAPPYWFDVEEFDDEIP